MSCRRTYVLNKSLTFTTKKDNIKNLKHLTTVHCSVQCTSTVHLARKQNSAAHLILFSASVRDSWA